MKSLLSYLDESLNSKQKKEVDSWEHAKHTFSDHAFGGAAPYDIIPLKDETHMHYEGLLAGHGYKLHDYYKGAAEDKYGRQVGLGKVLDKIGASDEDKKRFQVDQSRQV